MPRGQNLRTDDLHREIRKKFLQEDESHSLVQQMDQVIASNHDGNQRRVELWVTCCPQQALNRLYNDGSALEFLKFLESIEVHALVPGTSSLFETRRSTVWRDSTTETSATIVAIFERRMETSPRASGPSRSRPRARCSSS